MGHPATEKELIARARGLAGRTLGELADAHAFPLGATPGVAKGAAGRLLEIALGASGGSSRGPDFPRLGVELKTLPLRRDGRPKESTFVCTIPLGEVADTDFEDSVLYGRLRRVLFVPIEAEPGVPMPERRVGAAFVWSPEGRELALLRADWERVAAKIARGELEEFRAHEGEVLQVRPKGRDASERRLVETADGEVVWVRPRGFYLRASFTAELVQRAISGEA